MTKVTLIKNYRNTVTLKQLELQEIVQAIQDQAYKELFHQLRYVYPLAEVRQKYDATDGLLNLYTKDIPKVCFTSLMENRNKTRIMRAYTEDDGSYIRIGNYLNRPECKFESDRKASGMVYWVKER